VEWVVRAGIATPKQLIDGFGKHLGVGAPLYGFSVQYQPGRTIDELAQAGQYRNGQISYASDDDLAMAVNSSGYTMRLVKSPGRGFHHTFAVIYNVNSMMEQSLPLIVAVAISKVFRQMKNPYPVP
jgi:hypothetical protein